MAYVKPHSEKSPNGKLSVIRILAAVLCSGKESFKQAWEDEWPGTKRR